MNTKTYFTLLLSIPLILLLSIAVGAEIVPANRMIDWSVAGVEGGIPNITTENTFITTANDGIQDAAPDLQTAINNCPVGEAVLIPPGTYRLFSQITIDKGIVLRGSGIDNTIIISSNPGTTAIMVRNLSYGTFVNLTGGFSKGSTVITVTDASSFSDNDYVQIREEASNVGLGQMNKVLSVNQGTNQLTLEKPLYFDYDAASEIRTVNMVENAGLENFHIKTESSTISGYTGMDKIDMECAANSWVKNIKTEGYSGKTVALMRSYHCEVRDSYFFHTYTEVLNKNPFYAYGVEVRDQSSDCLVENNIFDYFRHALVLQHGASGNVLAYNFSWNVFTQGDGVSKRWPMSDIDVHQFEGFINLLEGNHMEIIDMESRHHYHTIMRNRVTYGGINPGQNCHIIGNEVPVRKYTHPTRTISNTIGTDPGCITHANYVGGTFTEEAGYEGDLANSYYLSSKPSWFGDLAWPPYGGDLANANSGANPNRIPAEVRYWSMIHPEEVPSNLTLQTPDSTTVELSWTNNSTNSVYFYVCRSEDGTNYERIAKTNQTTYTDTNISNGVQYWYYVRARNYIVDTLPIGQAIADVAYEGPTEFLGGESDPSNVVNTAEPSPPVDPEDADDPDAPDQQIGELEIKSYPNPYEYSAGSPMTFEFSGITGISTLKIYSIAGKLIKTIELAQGQTTIQWDGKDENGYVVASGLYMYVLTTSEGKIKKGKFAFVK